MPSWKDNLQPASFRGVPFFWHDHSLDLGRRTALFEFPFRDDPFVEDLGRKSRCYRLAGYVLGDDYFASRDALIKALEQEGPGTLVHPTLGQVMVQGGLCRVTETQQEGRIARFAMEFVPAGADPSPLSTVDTASDVYARLGDLKSALLTSFLDRFAIVGVPDFVTEAAAALPVAFAASAQSLLATAGVDVSTLTAPLAALAGIVSVGIDASAIGAAVLDLFGDFAQAAIDSLDVAVDSFSPVESRSRGGGGGPPLRDPSFGLAAFGGYGLGAAPIQAATPDLAIETGNRQAFFDLVRGAAVGGAAQIFAETDFASSNDALAARDTLTDLIDAQAAAAAAAGDDALYQSWAQLFASTAQDLASRAAQLPDLIAYSIAAPLPALVLAWRLYQDASRAGELVARNAAIHPGFMPLTGEALSS